MPEILSSNINWYFKNKNYKIKIKKLQFFINYSRPEKLFAALESDM